MNYSFIIGTIFWLIIFVAFIYLMLSIDYWLHQKVKEWQRPRLLNNDFDKGYRAAHEDIG